VKEFKNGYDAEHNSITSEVMFETRQRRLKSDYSSNGHRAVSGDKVTLILYGRVDYRKLNDVTKDCSPLPRIDDTLNTLDRAKWFSILISKVGIDEYTYTRTTKIKLHSQLAKGHGSSQSCPLASATLRRHLRGSWRRSCEVSQLMSRVPR
jgi:hypothetical protein